MLIWHNLDNMTDLDIQQAIATGQAKLSADSYSRYLKQSYGLANYCMGSRLRCVLLFGWAAGAWDNRPGAINAFALFNLNTLIAKLNEL